MPAVQDQAGGVFGVAPVGRRAAPGAKPAWRGLRPGQLGAVDTTQGAPHNPALLTGTRVREDATFDGGGVSRVAKGADCKSAGLRLRRFESYLPSQIQNSYKLQVPS